jgi:hypothetical protein
VRRTSRRHSTMNFEMMILSIIQQHASYLRSQVAIAKGDESFLKSVSPYQPPEAVTFSVIANTKCLKVDVRDIDGSESNDIVHQLLHSSLLYKDLLKMIFKAYGEKKWERLLSDDGTLSLELIQGISIEGNAESAYVGKVLLYATREYGQKRCPRHDFVFVNIEDDNHAPAKVLAFLKLSDSTRPGTVNWVAVVQYIQEISNESSNGVFVKYKWEEVNVQVRASKKSRREFNVDVIRVDTIIDHAFVIPDFSTSPI